MTITPKAKNFITSVSEVTITLNNAGFNYIPYRIKNEEYTAEQFGHLTSGINLVYKQLPSGSFLAHIVGLPVNNFTILSTDVIYINTTAPIVLTFDSEIGFVLQEKLPLITWDDANFTWDESQGIWDNAIKPLVLPTKTTITLTQPSKV